MGSTSKGSPDRNGGKNPHTLPIDATMTAGTRGPLTFDVKLALEWNVVVDGSQVSCGHHKIQGHFIIL